MLFPVQTIGMTTTGTNKVSIDGQDDSFIARLLGVCRWMGSHFHNWTDYNGVTFLVELLEWGHTFLGLMG